MPSKSTINITFKLDGDSKGFKDLASQADGLKVVMQSAAVEAEKFQASIINWSQGVQALGAVSQAVGNLNNALTSITAESLSFQKAMRAANTMAGKDADGFRELQGQVAELAKTIPVARDELAQGLYQVISNGVPEDNWISFLEASARSSVGGIANLGEAVTVTSTIIKNYGLAWEDAQSIQDKIQLTAKNGVTSFEQLAGALPSVAGSAAQLGVSIDELMSVFATCTGVTGNTAEVSTQLNAVLKALIKPTTEATRAAEQMGIQFDAAAVREAGGLDNFLKMVDTTIREYSAKTGELSETIYGNLFGSSRALRLLTSLTGEQADKFTENIGIMVDSAGTMDAAYETMSNTVSAQTQIFQNYISSLTDVVAGVIAPYQPLINLTAQFGQMAISVMALSRSFTALRGGLLTLVNNAKTLTAGIGLLTTAQGRAAIAANGWGNAARTAAIATGGLTVALRGLLVATGIGAAITALIMVIDKLTTSSKKAEDAVEKLDTVEDAFRDTTTRVQGEINTEISKLTALIKSNKDTTQAVADLNQKYGDIFGTYKTAAEWKDTLIQKSKDYVLQLGYEAQALELGKKLAETLARQDEALAKMREMEENGTAYIERSYNAGGVYGTGTRTVTVESTAYTQARKEESEAQQAARELNNKIEALQDNAVALSDKVKAANPPAQKMSDNLGTLATNTARAATNAAALKTQYQANADEIKRLTDLYTTQSEEEQSETQARIDKLGKEQAQIELLQAAAARPLELNTLRDYNNEIAYQTKLLQTATAEQAADILEVIQHLNEGKAAWSELSEVAQEPVAIDMVKNIKECQDAIDILSEKQQTASADEYAALEKEIRQYQALEAAMKRPAALLDMQSEVDSLLSLNSRELRIKVRAEGYEEFVDKIKSLKGMLNDSTNPVNDEQKKQIEDLIDAYSQLGAKAALSFGTLKDGWGSIEGIGNGVKSITDALTEDADAWSRVTAIINGFFQIYESIQKIISIIDALTLVSGKHAVAKQTEGTIVEEEAQKEIIAAGEVAGANLVESESADVTTVANIGKAASETFAAHSSIPFVGIAIAAGLIATMLAVMSSLKFAKGGIAYGPTLGLFGEYANASTNPEVVAPLDRLRSLLKTDDMQSGRVRFTIEGRTLVGVLEREYNVRNRR